MMKLYWFMVTANITASLYNLCNYSFFMSIINMLTFYILIKSYNRIRTAV